MAEPGKLKKRAKKPRKPDSRTVHTRQRILDEAERLFAQSGFHGTSMREVNAAAGSNVAAVHYHFNDKLQLFEAVIARRLDPIADACTENLKRCRAAGLSPPAEVEAMVRAIAEAFVEGTSGRNGQIAAELLNRALGETDAKLGRLANRRFDSIWEELHPLIRSALAHLPPATAYWRVYFMLGSVMRIIRRNPWLDYRSQGLCDPKDVKTAVDELVAYAMAALLAPPRDRIARP